MSIDQTTIDEHGLNADEYQRLLEILGREPTMTELGIFSVMWSEHCSYKSSRLHLRRLPTEGPRVVQGPGENAGAVDIGDGLTAVFKIESHNHPSFIEPYQGAATGVGGIIRDIFTMGARPIALLNSLRFGTLDDPATRRLVDGVVAGIAGYGNSIGIPTLGGEIAFESLVELPPPPERAAAAGGGRGGQPGAAGGRGGRGGGRGFGRGRGAPQEPGPVNIGQSVRLPTEGDDANMGSFKATFDTPGEYVIRIRIDNFTSGDSGPGNQCCWSNGYVRVRVIE